MQLKSETNSLEECFGTLLSKINIFYTDTYPNTDNQTIKSGFPLSLFQIFFDSTKDVQNFLKVVIYLSSLCEQQSI